MSETEINKLLEAEKVVARKNPLFLVEKGFLSIKTKSGSIVALKLNSAQELLLLKIKERLKKNKPVRLFLLKARQMGMSTLIEAILFAYTSQREGVNSTVISHDLDSSNYLFEMSKLYHERLDAHLRPEIKHSNEKKLEFGKIHSQIFIDTADNKNAGRSYTFRGVHLSECAYFPDLKGLLKSLNQSVPDLPETFIIAETTANGISNSFYKEWVAAVNGETDWDTLFIPWFKVREYSMSLVDGKMYPINSISFYSGQEKEQFEAEEKRLKEKYHLTDEQINWRRWAIVNKCNRSIAEFNQEYPDCWQNAFLSTGDCFFNKEALKEQIACSPKTIGSIVNEDGEWKLRFDVSGLFKIYEFPVKSEQYVIGADPAEGVVGGDKSAFVVINKRSNKTACVFNHNVPPEKFAECLMKAGHYYNHCLIACENKNYGYSVNQDLFKNYGSVYRQIKTKKGFKEPVLDIGWNTNLVTRPTMLKLFSEEISEHLTDLLDKHLIQQCWSFINNPKTKRPEADSGEHDDLVMARAIAGMVRKEKPYKPKSFRKSFKRRRRFRGLAGY